MSKSIPDFSGRKPQQKRTPDAKSTDKPSSKPPVPVSAPRVKPQSTSAKSGRRGG